MDPPPERSIAGTTAFMPRKQPYWLIWMQPGEVVVDLGNGAGLD
jgi:hypothetical protein